MAWGWAWKSFLRGHHTILMDFGLIGGVNPADPSKASAPGVPSFEAFEPVRYAMGDTRRYADRVQLIDMQPLGSLSSTGYVLALPGQEYLVLQPNETHEPFTVQLTAGRYAVEWYSVQRRETRAGSSISVEQEGSVSFATPFATQGPSILYIRSA